jgi:hypothetical protein
MYSLSQQDTSRDNRLNMLVESRVRREVQARFGGEFLETYRRNTARHRVLSLRLKAQYLFIFAGGLLAVFVVFVILYMAGVDQWVCIAFGVAAASVLVWLTFRLNTRYGEHGLMKLLAARRHPRYLLNRKSLRRLLKRKGGRV